MSHSQRTASEVIGKLGGQYPGELTISTPKKRCPFSPTHFVFFKSPVWEKKKKKEKKNLPIMLMERYLVWVDFIKFIKLLQSKFLQPK